MAAKTTAKKKATASKSSKPVTKVTSKKAKSTTLPVGVVSEQHPEDHRVSGKYTFFYVLFAVTTIIFAGLSVWLFIFSSELLSKYESIRACARNHTTCEIRYMGEDADGPVDAVRDTPTYDDEETEDIVDDTVEE